MKRLLSICFIVFMSVFLLTAFRETAFAASDPAVNFPDKKLEAALIKSLKSSSINIRGKITRSQALKLEYLKITNTKLTNLEGLQYFKNINNLEISNCSVGDISKLSSLKKLMYITLKDNQISSIKPLEGMAYLNILDMTNNKITDLTPLLKLKKLEMLTLNGNRTRDAYKLLYNIPSLKTIVHYNLGWAKNAMDKLDKMEKTVEKALGPIKPGMSDIEKERIINDFIVDNTSYCGNTEANYNPYGVLVINGGACTGFAETAKLLLNMAGIEATVISGSANNGSGSFMDHAWNIVKIDGKYYHLDVTWNDTKLSYAERKHSVPNRYKYRYFNLTDEEISKDHKWDGKSVPRCTTKSGLYGVHSYIICFDNNYVYYTNFKDFDKTNSTIYRKKLDGSSGEEVVASLDCTAEITKNYGDWIYITQLGHNFSVEKVKLDGSQIIKIKSFQIDDLISGVEDFHVKDGWIYLIRYDRITKLSEDGNTAKDILTGSPKTEIHSDQRFEDDWIYYRVTGEGGIYECYRISTDGTKKESVYSY